MLTECTLDRTCERSTFASAAFLPETPDPSLVTRKTSDRSRVKVYENLTCPHHTGKVPENKGQLGPPQEGPEETGRGPWLGSCSAHCHTEAPPALPVGLETRPSWRELRSNVAGAGGGWP